MKPVDVKYNTYIDFKKGVNDKDPKFKVGDHDLNNSFNSWIDKEDLVWFYWLQFHCIKLSQYFPKTYEPFGGDINVKVHLSNYATKPGIKNILHVDTSSFALKTNLASLKI